MTHFTPSEERLLYKAGLFIAAHKWTIIRIVYPKWVEARYGEADDVIRDASEATRKLNHQPLVEQSTIRHWMYAVDGMEKYWTPVITGELSFSHLEKAMWLENKGWTTREVALGWALENVYTTADQMKAHFCNPQEETKEARFTRRVRAKVAELRHIWQDPPQEVLDALDVLERYVE